MSFFSYGLVISFLRVYYLPPAAAKGKRDFLGTPQTPAKNAVLCTPVFHNYYAASFSL